MSEAVGLRVNARSNRGTVELLFTETSLCLREAARHAMDDIPDLLGMFLGTAIDPRRSGKGGLFDTGSTSEDVPLSNHLGASDEGLGIRVTEVPYACIIRSFLARPRGLRRAKLAFDSYDQRCGKVTSREFLLEPIDAKRVEVLLSSVMPERLEVH